MTPPMVLVQWFDTGMHMDHGWAKVESYADELDKPELMTASTCGFLVHENDEHLLVALSWDEANENALSVQVISQLAVIERTNLGST